MQAVISYNQAIKIAQKFANEIGEYHKNNIIAVYAIGSLGSDYYRPGQSDIDTLIITKYSRSERNEASKKIRAIADKYQDNYNVPKGFGAIVFAEEQLYPPYIKNEELILEILRLKTQAKLIYGEYDINKIPMPDKQAIINDAINFQEWVDSEKKNKEVDDYVREFDQTSFVNSILIVLRRYLIIEHGIIKFNKFKTVDIYLENNPPLINDEVFEYLNLSLHENAGEISNEKTYRMIKWREELYKAINDLVLYC